MAKVGQCNLPWWFSSVKSSARRCCLSSRKAGPFQNRESVKAMNAEA